jgi:hypothetical protein
MATNRFRSQIVAEDSTQAAGRYELIAARAAVTGTGASNDFTSDPLEGISLPNNGTASFTFYLPKDVDVTKAITIRTPIYFLAAAAASDAINLTWVYQNNIDFTTTGSDGDTVTSASVVTATGITQGSAITIDNATNWDTKFASHTATIAANTFAAADIDKLFQLECAATLTSLAVDEYVIPFVSIEYTRRFV